MRSRTVAGSLAVVIVSLMLVGFVSGTPLRHLIQITAALVALAAVLRGYVWSGYAALPVFAFWLFIVTMIWMYLLGISGLASGRYSPAEIAMTIAIGIASLTGVIAALRDRGRGWASRAAAAATLFLLQILAMWFSFRKPWSKM